MWIIQGNFETTFNYGPSSILNRQATLVNDDVNSVLHQIWVGGYSNGDYMFQIDARNETSYAELIAALGPRVFYENALSSERIYVCTADKSLIAYLLDKLLTLDPSMSETLVQINAVMQVDLASRYSNATMPGWLRRTDINRICNHDESPYMVRQGIYNNTNSSGVIIKISAFRYRNGSNRRVSAETKDRQNYDRLIQAMGNYKFYDEGHNRISVHGSNGPLFATFLNKLIEIHPDFREPARELAAGLGIELSTSLTAEELASFPRSSVSPDYVADSIELPAASVAPDHVPRSIDLPQLQIGSAPPDRQARFSTISSIFRPFNRQHLHTSQGLYYLDNHVGMSFRGIDDAQSNNFPSYPQNGNTEDAATRNALDNSFAEYYGHTSATYLPSRNNATTAPVPTDEEHKLFKEAESKGYTCPISLEIMTDPVSIKGHEQSGNFERSAIKNWLETHNRHPLTNAVVTDKTLVPNTELKTAIEKFNTHKLKI